MNVSTNGVFLGIVYEGFHGGDRLDFLNVILSILKVNLEVWTDLY